jgi:hypothetical protein
MVGEYAHPTKSFRGNKILRDIFEDAKKRQKGQIIYFLFFAS